MADAEHRGHEARHLLEKLEPYFAGIEAAAVETMLNASDDEGRREGRDRVKAIRALRNELHTAIAIGKQDTANRERSVT